MKNQKIIEVHYASGRMTRSEPMSEAELRPIKAAYDRMIAAGTVKTYEVRDPADVYARHLTGGRHG